MPEREEFFPSDVDALAFDFNVMLLGMAAELRAQEAAKPKPAYSFTSSRHEAKSLARRAQAAFEELEAEIVSNG